jgi:hypothetical protein
MSKLITATCILAVVFIGGIGFYWDDEPPLFDVMQTTVEMADKIKKPVVIGTATVATQIHIVDVLFNKRGGYLSNDVLPPSVMMDNVPEWEYGVLLQVRDLVRAMRDRISRSQSQSAEDKDLAMAEARFSIEHTSWIMPDAESEYKEAIEYLKKYLLRLSNRDKKDAQFYARADNLNYWLGIVEVRLGGLSQRLSASVGQKRINTDLAGEKAARQSTRNDDELIVKTSWFQVDNVFYEARGSTWALLHLLKAIEVDFADVLEDKNAQVSIAQIIRELEATQQELDAFMVLNGSGFGFLANHSLVMAAYISRANAAIIDLRELLEKG